MTDEARPADDLVAAVAALISRVNDLETTLKAQVIRMPTGLIGASLLPAAPADALLCWGQPVLRDAYPGLFQYATVNGLFTADLFGVGDGSTTFTMPDWRERTLVNGNGTTYLPGGKFGVNGVVLTDAQLSSHTHTVNNHSNHAHPLTGGSVPGGGDHGGHFDANQVLVAGGPTYGVAPWNSPGSTRGFHGHGAVAVFSDQVGLSAHVVGTTGSDASHENRQPSVVVTYFIWT